MAGSRAPASAAGGPLEIVEERVLGERMRVFGNRPRSVRSPRCCETSPASAIIAAADAQHRIYLARINIARETDPLPAASR